MSTHDLLEHACAVAKRQAFGARFEPRADDRAVTDQLMAGKVEFPPHPVATIGFPVDWDQDPFGQRNWRAQLHMLRWLDPARRLAAQGDATAMVFWESVVTDWITKNPPRTDKSSYAWADMIDGVRVHALLVGLPYVSDQSGLLEALDVHGQWLADPANLGHDNHALHQHAALAMVGSALRKDAWLDLAVRRIDEYVVDGYDEHGVNAEAAPGYWLLNYRWLRDVGHRLELAGRQSSAIAAALTRIPQTIVHATRPDGMIEEIGDTAPRQRLVAGEADELTYVATEGAEGSPPTETAVLYGRGYAFGRSGWGETARQPAEESFYSLRFGRADATHGHQDGGGLTYFAGGKPVLVDAGKYAYVRDEGRVYALGRLGHNIVHIRGKKYDKSTSVELVASRLTDSFDYFHVRDLGYPGVTLDRRVVYSRQSEALLVLDSVRAADDVVAEARWHLHEDSRATVAGRGRVDVRNAGSPAAILWGGSAPEIQLVTGGTDPMDGWRSPVWGQMVPTTVVKAVRRGSRFRFVTAIFAGASTRTRLESGEARDGAQSFVIEANGIVEQIWVGADGVSIERLGTSGHPSVSSPVEDRAEVDGDTVAEFEQQNSVVRTSLHGSDPPSAGALTALVRRLESGWDYGATAAIVDAAERWPEAKSDAWSGDTRSRAGLWGDPADGDLGGAELHCYPSLAHRYALTAEDSRHLVELGPLALPFHVHRTMSSRDLVVSLHGALNRATTRLPRFERLRSLRALQTNVVAFADPTLDLDPASSLSWYLGTRSVDLHVKIAEVIRTVAEQIGAERIVLTGTSGGGFAALQVGAHLPVSAVVAASPQTDILRYHPRFSARAISGVFGSETGLRDGDRPRVSVLDRYRQCDASPMINYLINSGDGHHVKYHGEPFWALMRERFPDRLSVHRLSLGKGHVAPSPEILNAAITAALKGLSE
ncbi:heparinase II/III domain-containing protein [Promicromonospora aerolata]|uniref:Heparinase II/III family protein n=1 Tax=Promicromonospora aerolata TaxID=195749 RepID=A0ABW4V898_9MICO